MGFLAFPWKSLKTSSSEMGEESTGLTKILTHQSSFKIFLLFDFWFFLQKLSLRTQYRLHMLMSITIINNIRQRILRKYQIIYFKGVSIKNGLCVSPVVNLVFQLSPP